MLLSCPNPWDGRPTTLEFELGGDQPWCNRRFVEAALCTAFAGVSRAWWDLHHVVGQLAGHPLVVPWLEQKATPAPGGVTIVEIPQGYEIVRRTTADRYWLAPKGWPPAPGFEPSQQQRVLVEENLRTSFGRSGRLSVDEMVTVRKAFAAVHAALVGEKIRLRCTTRSCGGGTVAWAQASDSLVRLCSGFFGRSTNGAAATLFEELLHHYGEIPHVQPGEEPSAATEANLYSMYLLAFYLQ